MAIVQDYYLGAIHIVIRNDECCSPEEVKNILKRISEQAARSLYKEEPRMDETAK